MGTPLLAYEVAAAIQDEIAPASVIPSSRIWPPRSSRYHMSCSESCGR